MQTLLPFEKIQRVILVKKPARTDPKFGCAPEQRTMQELLQCSVVNINKPKGPTSHQVAAYLQKIFKINKTGHSGTLDPNVTGILPLALGRGTKVIHALLTAGKEYVCIMHLHKPVPEEKIREAMQSFVGKIKQLPPLKSAVKREWRFRKVYYLEVLEMEGQEILFKVGCQAGTYIRKLCHDLGQEMGVGAHMAELIRTKAGPFSFNQKMVTLQDCQDALYYFEKEDNPLFLKNMLLPIEAAVQHLPKIWVADQTVDSLCHGSDLKVPGIAQVESEIQGDEMVTVFTLKNELIALGEAKMISKEILQAEKGLAVKINKVVMQPGVYPKWRKEA
ncbi:RNA-guided pseudouridylation complex pseudouridine synthase subunit Cbf5 [Candidatus Woesearchaeota archaeon]|nr:RNA-guided pseudouridylation complex pseudouridine synthase subunit Cbf5 [Candidatus Woesearchaeota archaeon]